MSVHKKLEAVEYGKLIRNTRRNIGLSQEALSSLLGITQARVSRWESGREEMPRKHRLSLIELISNKSGKIDPLIDRLIRRDPSFAVTSFDTSKILRESEKVLNAFKLNRSEVDGATAARIFNAEWKKRLPIDPQMYRTDYVRDIDLAGNAIGSGLRMRMKMFSVELSGYDRIYVRQNFIVGPSEGKVEADMLEHLRLEDLE